MLQNLTSAAVVIGALRVNQWKTDPQQQKKNMGNGKIVYHIRALSRQKIAIYMSFCFFFYKDVISIIVTGKACKIIWHFYGFLNSK